MSSQPRRPVGRLTVALTLIAIGAGLLASTFGFVANALVLFKLWPLLLISLGAEVLVARWQGAPTRFDWGGVLLIGLFIALLSSGAAAKQVIDGGGIPIRFFAGSDRAHDESSFNLTPEIKRVRLETGAGTVRLHGATGSTVAVSADFYGNARGTESPRIRFEAQHGTLQISLTAGDWTNVSAQYQVELPAGLAVEVESDSGLIDARGIQGELRLANHSGTINVEDGEGNVDITTHSGLIEVTNRPGAIKAGAHSGAIRLTGVDGWVEAHTDSGVISVGLRPGVGARVEAMTDSGPIRGPVWLQVAAEGAKRSAVGQVGDGQKRLLLSTHSGPITIEQP